ncbi:cation:proton antiporter [candidate division KSB1 bacterium]|nr:MAG: cation:proton antiporter [candidate division KSB1 bacterium]
MFTIGISINGIGSIFLFLGSLSIFRLPDVYNRRQAGTKCTTVGAFFTIIGVGLMEPTWFWKTLVIALFILLTNPISNHALGRASCKSGVPLCDKTVVDKTKEFEEYKPLDDELEQDEERP